MEGRGKRGGRGEGEEIVSLETRVPTFLLSGDCIDRFQAIADDKRGVSVGYPDYRVADATAIWICREMSQHARCLSKNLCQSRSCN